MADLTLQSLLCFCLFGATLGQELDAVKVFVVEGGDVIFPCSLGYKENIQSKLFDWRKVAQQGRPPEAVFLYYEGSHYNNGRPGQSEQYEGRVSHFQDQLMNGNASIILRNAKMADRGMYSCNFPRLNKISYVNLVVAAAPRPSVTILNIKDGMVLLQCDVNGASPEPEVQWTDGHGNILPAEEPKVSERGGIYSVTVRITVTKTDRYHCVSTQKTIGHQSQTEIYVPISEEIPPNFIIACVSGLVLVASIVVILFLVIKRHKKRPPEPPSCSCDEKPLRSC